MIQNILSKIWDMFLGFVVLFASSVPYLYLGVSLDNFEGRLKTLLIPGVMLFGFLFIMFILWMKLFDNEKLQRKVTHNTLLYTSVPFWSLLFGLSLDWIGGGIFILYITPVITIVWAIFVTTVLISKK